MPNLNSGCECSCQIARRVDCPDPGEIRGATARLWRVAGGIFNCRVWRGAPLFLLLLFATTPLRAAIAMVQVATNAGGGSTTKSATFGSNTSAGNLIIACASFTDTTTFSSVSDTQSNSFTQFGTEVDDGEEKAHCYYAKNIVGGADTVTFTVAASAYIEMYIHEVSGVSYTNPFDQSCTAPYLHPGTNTISCGVTTTAANEILFGFDVNGNTPTPTPSSGFTADQTTDNNLTEHEVVSSAGAHTIGMSESNQGVLIGGTFEGPVNPTEIRLSSFAATQYSGGQVAVHWRTGFESDNLGFHLYRESGGQRVEVTPSLLAGSALFAGEKTPLASGNSYAWSDTLPPNSAPAQYWLEEVDLHGQHIWHGPVAPDEDSVSTPPWPTARSPLLKQLGLGIKPSDARFRRSRPPAETKGEPAQDGFGFSEPSWEPEPPGISQQLRTQWALAAGAAVKIGVQSDGWYRVASSDLIAAGFAPGANPRTLRLFADGEEVPIVVDAGAGARWQPTAVGGHRVLRDRLGHSLHRHACLLASRRIGTGRAARKLRRAIFRSAGSRVV